VSSDAGHAPGHAVGHGAGHDDEEHEEHVNHEAWVIPYADMLTLLMALFLMLYAMGTTDLIKFKALAESLADGLGGSSSSLVGEGGESLLDGAGTSPIDLAIRQQAAEAALVAQEERAQAVASESERLGQAADAVHAQVAAAGLGDAVQFRQEVRGLVITVVADDVLFDPGSAELRPGGVALMAAVASTLAGLPNDVAVEGHTDDRPISTAAYPSNWELSTARATSVLRYLVDHVGFPSERASASGYGAERPIAGNDTPEGRSANRRVEIAVLSDVPAPPHATPVVPAAGGH
jgi:chemotaxis protein MotB